MPGVAGFGHKKAPECVIGGYALRSSFWANARSTPGGSGLLESAYWLVAPSASTANNYFRFIIRGPEKRFRQCLTPVLVGGHFVGDHQYRPALVMAQPGPHRAVQCFREAMGEAAFRSADNN